MNKPIALLPMLLLLAPGVVIGAGLTARNFRLYYPLFAVLMVALLINVAMMICIATKNKTAKSEAQAPVRL